MSDNDLQVQYASQSMHYTTQFVASKSGEEVVLDCGSVVVTGGPAGSPQWPVHTRMALHWSAVHRLHELLGEMIESHQSSTQTQHVSRASLPTFSHKGEFSQSGTAPDSAVSTPVPTT